MRYVVTGAAGFIGSHLTEALLEAGHEVVALDCFTDYYDPALKAENARGLDVRAFDLAEEPLDDVFDGAAGSRLRVVFASSSSVYGDAETYPTPEDADPRPISPYGITKLACEHLARSYATSDGLDAVLLRYFTVYGPRQRPDMAFARLVAAL